nr:winged helix-turn-helix domain-containing protein [uncultured Allomuricauda sp.]
MEGQNIKYLITGWTIDPEALEIAKGKKRIRTQNKIVQVLVVLIEANGNVVTKEELYNKVWKGIVVTENSLNKAISELRKIFGDSRSEPKFIETIPKKGYRLLVEVKKVAISKDDIPVYVRKRKPILLFFMVSILVFLAIGQYKNLEINQQQVLSPDGEKIAYFKKGNGHSQLLVKNVVNGKVDTLTQLTKPESFALNWSPKNDKIVYNATLPQDSYYSINIMNLEDRDVLYIKFAKKEENHAFQSVPEDLDKELLFLDHRELVMGENKIHHIYLANNDTIKVLFKKALINDFNW